MTVFHLRFLLIVFSILSLIVGLDELLESLTYDLLLL